MRRIQEYVECYVQSLDNQQDKQAAAHVTIQAWAALKEYTHHVHQQLYVEYNELLAQPQHTSRKEMIKERLQYMNKVAEYTCGSQAGLLRAQAWENRLNRQ